jgi:hypothetical protein
MYELPLLNLSTARGIEQRRFRFRRARADAWFKKKAPQTDSTHINTALGIVSGDYKVLGRFLLALGLAANLRGTQSQDATKLKFRTVSI